MNSSSQRDLHAENPFTPPSFQIINGEVYSSSYVTHYDSKPEFLACFETINEDYELLGLDVKEMQKNIVSIDFMRGESLCAVSTCQGETFVLNTTDPSIFQHFDKSLPNDVNCTFTYGNLLGRNYVTSLSRKKTNLQVINVGTNEIVTSHPLDVMCSSFLLCKDRMLATTYQGNVVTISLDTFQITSSVVPNHAKFQKYTSLVSCRNGKHLVLGSYDDDLTFIDQDTLKEVAIVEIRDGVWSIVEYNEDCFYCGGGSGMLYQVEDLQVINEVHLHNDMISSLVLRDGVLYSLSIDGSFVIFDTNINEIVKMFKFDCENIYAASFSAISNAIYFASGPNLFKYQLPTSVRNFDKVRRKTEDVRFIFV